MVNMEGEFHEDVEDSRDYSYAHSSEIQSHNRGVYKIDSIVHKEAKSTLDSLVAWPARKEEIQRAKDIHMARLEALQKQYVRRNKAKYPQTIRDPSSSNPPISQAKNAIFQTPQEPKQIIPSVFYQNKTGQATRGFSNKDTATNQQIVYCRPYTQFQT